jgi:hypothetical protein
LHHGLATGETVDDHHPVAEQANLDGFAIHRLNLARDAVILRAAGRRPFDDDLTDNRAWTHG